MQLKRPCTLLCCLTPLQLLSLQAWGRCGSAYLGGYCAATCGRCPPAAPSSTAGAAPPSLAPNSETRPPSATTVSNAPTAGPKPKPAAGPGTSPSPGPSPSLSPAPLPSAPLPPEDCVDIPVPGQFTCAQQKVRSLLDQPVCIMHMHSMCNVCPVVNHKMGNMSHRATLCSGLTLLHMELQLWTSLASYKMSINSIAMLLIVTAGLWEVQQCLHGWLLCCHLRQVLCWAVWSAPYYLHNACGSVEGLDCPARDSPCHWAGDACPCSREWHLLRQVTPREIHLHSAEGKGHDNLQFSCPTECVRHCLATMLAQRLRPPSTVLEHCRLCHVYV
jgi:hypothetical protein